MSNLAQVMPGAFAHATIGVSDLQQAASFWTGHFGFETAVRREGPDADLAGLWNLAPTDITRQAIVRTPGATAGAVHLVEFARPALPVRSGAAVFDQLPKNIDIYVREMSTRFATLKAAGVRFRTEPVTAPGPGGMVFREVHLEGHDETNMVLLEIIGEGYDVRCNSRGFAGVGPIVTIVPDLAAEERFYTDLLGMAITLDLRLDGPVIEQMIGLPPGAALLLKVFGDPLQPLGRVEVIEYERARGVNLYHRARPPATGLLHVTYGVGDLSPLLWRLRAADVPVIDHGERGLLYGDGRVVSFCTPAGFRIEVQERTHARPVNGSADVE
jgi:catechol 2,3-dioxygenase-like lactoylglutathione lyase family enzyme